MKKITEEGLDTLTLNTRKGENATNPENGACFPSLAACAEQKAIVHDIKQDKKLFLELKRRLETTNFFQKDPWHYFRIISVISLGYLGAYFGLFYTEGWLRFFNAVLLAFFTVQYAYISHDAGHYQISYKRRVNDIFGHIGMTFVSGFSFSYWRQQHNKHHRYSQEEERDPDMQSDLVALYETSARRKKGLGALVLKGQHYLLWILYALHIFQFRSDGIIYIANNLRQAWKDIPIIGLHIFFLFAVPVYVLGWQVALFNYLVMSMFCGLFYGPVFIVNHVGTEIVRPGEKRSFLRQQVETSRNVVNPAIFDFYFGALNYQIQHHLFSSVARSRYRPSSKIVREFCAEHGVHFREESYPRALYNVYKHLKNMRDFKNETN